jgi:hypothetical protein
METASPFEGGVVGAGDFIEETQAVSYVRFAVKRQRSRRTGSLAFGSSRIFLRSAVKWQEKLGHARNAVAQIHPTRTHQAQSVRVPALAHSNSIPTPTISQRIRLAVSSSSMSNSPFRRMPHVRNHTEAIRDKASEKKPRGDIFAKLSISLTDQCCKPLPKREYLLC